MLTFSLVTVTLIFGCKKEFPDEPFTLMDLVVGECKAKGNDAKGSEQEYLIIRTVDDYYIQVNHFNSLFSCEPGEISVSVEITGDTITLNENESMSQTNCVCPYDIEFRLGPLDYGDYFMIFQKAGWTFKEYTVDFRKSTDIEIDI